jgi:hypothetical protein
MGSNSVILSVLKIQPRQTPSQCVSFKPFADQVLREDWSTLSWFLDWETLYKPSQLYHSGLKLLTKQTGPSTTSPQEWRSVWRNLQFSISSWSLLAATQIQSWRIILWLWCPLSLYGIPILFSSLFQPRYNCLQTQLISIAEQYLKRFFWILSARTTLISQ